MHGQIKNSLRAQQINKNVLSGLITIEVVLQRRLFGIIMTIYMPSILLNLIGHSTNFFKSDYFDSKITVNVTVRINTEIA